MKHHLRGRLYTVTIFHGPFMTSSALLRSVLIINLIQPTALGHVQFPIGTYSINLKEMTIYLIISRYVLS